MVFSFFRGEEIDTGLSAWDNGNGCLGMKEEPRYEGSLGQISAFFHLGGGDPFDHRVDHPRYPEQLDAGFGLKRRI
jgi:hypothetical protein